MGAGGKGHDGEAAELHVACFMGLVSFFASRVEVMRVAPRHKVGLTNAAARANIQSATLTETPLTDAGLNGAGQVIQVVDSGLDESSCFFAHDATGDQVTHGYYFDDLGFNYDIFESWTTSATFGDNRATNKIFTLFKGGNFTADLNRRKIVQYINLIKPDNTPEELDASFTTRDGRKFPWLTAGEFENDKAAGHGTHVAGSAAGATLYTPAETIACENGKIIGCVGGCINQNASAGDLTDDDLVTTSEHAASHAFFDIDRLCSDFGCGEESNKLCLRNNVSETLTKSGGVAPGAKLAIFDAVFKHDFAGGFAGNGLWEACVEAGCRLHSNSYGSDNECMLTPSDILYDEFMYENPEHLLIFAAGNDGNKTRQDCTVNSPAIAKNVLAVGASTSGSTRISATSAAEPSKDTAGIDEIAYFSAYGFTKDGRIKPEVVAPGDSVYSAASDGEEDKYSCRLFAFAGTSMSCPIVAGAAAMIRQYFMDAQFYGADLKARGFCGDWDGCEGFVPSAATLKAMLINSANLMGGGSEPTTRRGFGRVHLDVGMPLAGNGNLALLVKDSSNTTIEEFTQTPHYFFVDADADLDLRVTLSWIDRPATTTSESQLVHDLDVTVMSPRGEAYIMWNSTRMNDSANVNERVIVDADDVVSGIWYAEVWANKLLVEDQSYSLVISGAIEPRSRSTCSNDVLGIEGTNEYGLSACCPSECNQCGGKGCGTSGLPKYTYQSCCVGAVVHTFEHCEVKNTAPCAIIDGKCSNGLAGFEGTSSDRVTACCPFGCNQCGGAGCNMSGLTAGYGSEDCCITGGVEFQKHCDATGAAPCVINDQRCSNGLPGFEEKNSDGITVCCPIGCGQCGGDSCANFGLPNYGAEKCCIYDIVDSWTFCHDTETAPCVVNGYPDCTGEHPWIGDGMCDKDPSTFGDLNVPECGYDGGDCCACSCENGGKTQCGNSGYKCLDPSGSKTCP